MKENQRLRLKAKFLEELAQRPIIETACSKSGLKRSTCYRWMGDDEQFSDDVDLAIAQGVDRMNDMAESQLIKGIGNGDFRFIKYWLSHNHRRYVAKTRAKRPFRLLRMRLGNSDDEW